MTVFDTSIEDGAVFATAPTSLTVTFSAPLFLPSLSAGDGIISDPGGGMIPATGVTVIDARTVEFDITGLVTADGLYTFDLGADARTADSRYSSEKQLAGHDVG